MTRSELPTAADSVDPQAVRRDLEAVVAGDVRFDRLTRGLYANDAGGHQIVPMGVVLPQTQQDVLDTLAVCVRWGVPLTARGGGTSQKGQCLGTGVVVDFSRYFTNIFEVNIAEKWARVEPGVVLDDLNCAVQPHGLRFGLDIATSNRATIGGLIADNTLRIDHVLGLKVLLADGSIIVTQPLCDDDVAERCRLPSLEGACYRTVRRLHHFPPARSASDGAARRFNLSDVFVGSQGTLGLILDATIRIVDVPAVTRLESAPKQTFGPAPGAEFRELKRTFDPDNVLNPDVRAGVVPQVSAKPQAEIPTTFDFSAQGGIVRAAEQCTATGVCRQRRQGIMCPSYQATREEQHSTRGRANILRLALTGQLGFQGLTDRAVKDVLELCLECKACKSECPNHVDLARMKAEFLHQYRQKHGLPWRNWLFGNVAGWYRLGLKHPRLFKMLTEPYWARRLAEIVLGVDRHRLIPAPAHASWSQRQSVGDDWCEMPSSRRQRRVLLFPDTFMNYIEPELGYAVQEVLARLGCETVAPGCEPSALAGGVCNHLTCCVRPFIANGMLDEAMAAARHNVERLYPWAANGEKIIACEPSCILTIKDDYPALLRGDWGDKAKTVAAACRTFEEFALETWDASLPLAAAKHRRILVQAHCHQRSLVGMEPLLHLLRRIPGAEVIDLDAGCCGGAGSFGYEREHYEISRLVGEQRLFPALRQLATDDSIVVAPGFSCRQQIEHFTGIRALHPAQLLGDLLPSA